MVSRNQVDGLHQQIVVEVLVYFQQKVEAHLSQSEGNNQSGNLQKEVSETFGFFFNLNVVKFREVRSNPVIYEFWLRTSQLLCVDEFEGLSERSEVQHTLFRTFYCIFRDERPIRLRDQ